MHGLSRRSRAAEFLANRCDTQVIFPLTTSTRQSSHLPFQLNICPALLPGTELIENASKGSFPGSVTRQKPLGSPEADGRSKVRLAFQPCWGNQLEAGLYGCLALLARGGGRLRVL
jgi:hypothetical protein